MTVADTYANYSHEWYTPPRWWDWVHELLGGSVFDPCPPNRGDFDGLVDPWDDLPTYLNIPGGRGAPKRWWNVTMDRMLLDQGQGGYVWKYYWAWCFFSSEMPRHLYPHPKQIPGFLIEPRERIAFIWGGPTLYKIPAHKEPFTWDFEKDGDLPDRAKLYREHGKPCKSPATQTLFWTCHHIVPAPPDDCIITKTGETANGYQWQVAQKIS